MSRWAVGLVVALAGFLGAAAGFIGRDWVAQHVPEAGASAQPSFADIVERVNPAVVQVATLDRIVRPRVFDLDTAPRWPELRGDGAGFVVDPEGLILTNEHLVGRSSRIRVRLADGREFGAALVGGDPSTDLALLRVSAGRLPAVALGDSDRLRAGDWVCAIGNPLRFEHSVSVGVVSSKGRKIFDASFDAFIQTDAAINPGSSGGPLLDAAGEVVGVNAAVSRQGQGIGFAIPINVARDVLSQLKEHGHVSRGYLGVQLENVDAELAAFLGAPGEGGALVSKTIPDGAAEVAHLQRYDLIRAVSGRPVADADALIRMVSATPPGAEVRLDVIRDARPLTIVARLGERGEQSDDRREVRGPQAPQARREAAPDRLGLVVSAAAAGDQPHARRGVVLEEVWSLSSGAEGLDAGDVIEEVNRRPTPDLEAYRQVVAGLAADSAAWLYVHRPRADQSFLAKLRVEEVQER